MKTLILLEMAALAGGGLLTLRYGPTAPPADNGQVIGPAITTPWQVVVLKTGLKRMIAVFILLILLLSAAEVGLGTAAALFGGLAALGYILSAIGVLGPALETGANRLFNP